jgi:hypothetical protein
MAETREELRRARQERLKARVARGDRTALGTHGDLSVMEYAAAAIARGDIPMIRPLDPAKRRELSEALGRRGISSEEERGHEEDGTSAA